MSEEDQLHELDWVPIPNEPYIMKYIFSDTHYNILVSNLASLYHERLEDANIQKRFSELNPYAQMKSQVILENLKKSLQKSLTKESDLSIRFNGDKLVVTLKFPVAHVSCNYEVKMNLMAADKVLQYVISPTVFGALLSQRKVLELQKKTSLEVSKASISNVSVSSQNLIEPEWLKGQNVPMEIIIDSFLQIQNHFKSLYAENCAAHSLLSKEKSKKLPVQCPTPKKMCRLQENINDESASVKFEDDEQSLSIKEEREDSVHHSDANCVVPKMSSNSIKKKKIFKI